MFTRTCSLVVALSLAACPSRPSRLAGTYATVTESFEQKRQAQALDVLFVVDNSRSMGPVQQKLAANLGVFFEWIDRARVDYQVAVTSTDAVGVTGSRPAARGRFSSLGGAAIVRPNTPNAVQVLAANVALGTDGTNTEQPLFSALSALGAVKAQRGTPPAGNEGFVRAGARLGIIFITDEDDLSPLDAGDFLLALRDLKGPGNPDAVFLGGVLFDGLDLNPAWRPAHPERVPARGCTTGTADQRPSVALIDLLAQAPYPSAIASICGDFQPALRRLAIEAVGFETRFRLAQQADPVLTVPCDGRQTGAFCVRVDGAVVPETEYTYEAATNELVFSGSYVPPLGSRIAVDFVVRTQSARERDETLGEVSACASDADCPVGVRCGAGRCVLECSAPEHCSDGFTCSEGACRCQADSSCKAGEVCTPSGACQPRPRCQSAAQCGPGLVCEHVSGECRPAGECARPDVSSAGWAIVLGAMSCSKGQFCDGARCAAGCLSLTDCGPGETCRWPDGAPHGTCARGCQSNTDCCLGQRCDAASGQCLAAPGTVSGSTVIPLCDRASCAGTNACTSAGGTCGARYDTDYSCVPRCMTDGDCAKGYSCEFALVHTSATACTFGGPACSGGRTCSATAESPQGVCSCTTDSECGADARCADYGSVKYCTTRQGACYPRYECAQLRSNEPLVCNERF